MVRSARKNAPSLPRLHRWDADRQCAVNDADAIKAEETAIPQRATPERFAKAASHAIGREDKIQRVTAAPLDAFHARCALDPDLRRNIILFDAGQRYLRHWHGAALCGLASRDPRQPGGGFREQAWANPPSEAVARERLGAYLARWVDTIVIEERAPLEVGREATRYTDKTTATAIAMEVLRAGLTTLADHWGMLR